MSTARNFQENRMPKPPFPKEEITPPGVEENMKTKPDFIQKDYKGSEKLKNKIALITGGDSGIGRSVAVHFALEGASVAFTYLPSEKKDADFTLAQLEEIGVSALAIEGDVSTPEGCDKILETFLKSYDHVDVLVNNAAFQEHVDSFEELSFDHFKQTFEVNIFGYFNMIKSAFKNIPEGGSIINTASILGHLGDESLIDYAATKGAILNLTKSLARGFRSKSIRVNAVAPGPVWTPLNPAERDYEEMKNFGKDYIHGRPAQPFEIAPAYVYLASDITGSYITGETINILGTVI